jgi:error-prone DNA polymerase
MPTPYAELHCLSNFTFLRGASHPEELVIHAKRLGYHALALTDECSLAGVVRAHVAANIHQLKLIIGSEFRLRDGPKLVLLAMNKNGYGNLSQLITRARRVAEKGAYQISCADLEQGIADCCAILIPVQQPLSSKTDAGLATNPSSPDTGTGHTAHDHHLLHGQAGWLQQHFPGRCWIAGELLGSVDDRGYLAMLQTLSRETGVPLVAAGDVHMHARERRILQDVVTAIRLNTPVQDAGQALYPNGERHLRPLQRLQRIYPPALLQETVNIAALCNFSLDQIQYEYPEELVPPDETPGSYLRRLVASGARRRWPEGVPGNVQQQIDHELALITELGYEPYFLTVYDIVDYARRHNILCQGRGSAANSAVCFCLGITEVDPARMNMLFERFISKERNEPPDIDVDFENDRREEVIQYIYNKYGRDRAALAATVITYRPRSAFRDAGKALGLDALQVDRLARAMAWWDGKQIKPQRLIEAGFDPANPHIVRLVSIVNELVGFPRHLSQHVGGFVISHQNLSRIVPIENAAMPERTVIQWDKDDLDTLNLLKVDCLALGMLSAIHRAFDLVRGFRGTQWTMATLPAEDPAVYAMIQQADTVGVFQIESRAQMAMLPRLKPKTFYDLVIEVAIVRPGPIQGDMVHPYLRRRQGKEAVSYPSEDLKKVLERTLGVPIFQEQVMQIAMVAAGFSPGEADQLRRAMAAWRRHGQLEHFEQRLIEGMRSRGYSDTFARQIYQQILGFGEYGFPESHSASFSLLVYVSAWLKCHEPAAFTCALLNSQPMGFYPPAQLVQDARRHHVEVRPVDVCHSDRDCTLEQADEGEPALRLGLRQVKGLSQAAGQRIVNARRQKTFANVEDLAQRAQLNKKDLQALAAADALRTLSGHRHHAHWHTLAVEESRPLLDHHCIREQLPLLLPPSEGQDIVADYAHTGLTLRRHPLALLRPRLQRLHIATAEDIKHIPHGSPVHVAGLVTARQRPGGGGVTFVTLEDETGYVNGVIWANIAERQRRVLLQARLLGIHGRLETDGDVIHIIAQRLEDYSKLLGRLTTRSRDFH